MNKFRHEWNEACFAFCFYKINDDGTETFIGTGHSDCPNPGDNGYDWEMCIRILTNDESIWNTYGTTFGLYFSKPTVLMVNRWNCSKTVWQETITTFFKRYRRGGKVK